MLHSRLIEALGADGVKTSPEDLSVYAFDAYAQAQLPSAVVLPQSTRDVSAIVKIAKDCGEPIVARGAGTGLCGGAVPAQGGIIISFARMNKLLNLDVRNKRARVQPGLVNLDLSRATEPSGLFYAPDPSSQKTSTIGGNCATNAGGPHCLSYGTTVNHILGLEVVDHEGEVFTTSINDAGYDLTGTLVGSEGTLAIICAADVRLLNLPESVRVWVAAFADVEAASETVSAIIGAGIVPTALEIMDDVIVRAVEASYHAGYPMDAGAVLLIEHAGFNDDMDERERAIEKIARAHGAISWRSAHSQAERDILWAGRKGAAGATGRIAPNYYTQDVCVPRSKLPAALHEVTKSVRAHNLQVGNVFHAGDGNLHPLLMYDKREPRQVDAVNAAGTEILHACIELGGTISGEHGIGSEKREMMAMVYNEDDLGAMMHVREVFDPSRRLNPEKIFPVGSRCPEVR